MSGRRWLSFARAAVVVAVLALPLAGTVPAAAAGHTGFERVVRITFPVKGNVYYANTYDAPRSGGRVHQAADIMGSKMQRVHAAKGGTVCYITGVDEKVPSYGYMITICGKDGLRYSYIHMNNDRPGTDNGKGGIRYAYAKGLRRGSEVVRGQFLGYLGDSGNAESTAPHLHFEIADPELDDDRIDRGAYDRLRINPYFSLRRAEGRGDYPGARYPERNRPKPDPEPQPQPAPQPEPETAPEPEPAPVDAFGDIAGSTHRRAINRLARAGIAGGCGSETFCPNAPVTRSQMASLITRAAVVPYVTAVAFDDMAGSPHAAAANALAFEGVVSGCAARQFCPSAPVTRAQMATFLARAFDLTPQVQPPFRDVSPYDNHAATIAAVTEAGISAGCRPDRYCPNAVVTRGQMATFLARALT